MKFSIRLTCTMLFCIAGLAQAQTPRPAGKPTTRPSVARPGPDASGLEVVIKSAKIDFLMLKKAKPNGGFDELVSDDNLLVIRLQITNKGTKEIKYKTFSGTPNGTDDRAALMDSNKKFTALLNFGDVEVVDGLKEATLKPGDSVSDVLAFAPLAAGVKPVTLILPAKNHGDQGLWRLDVTLEDKAAAPTPK